MGRGQTSEQESRYLGHASGEMRRKATEERGVSCEKGVGRRKKEGGEGRGRGRYSVYTICIEKVGSDLM